MAHGKLDMLAIDHGHGPVLEVDASRVVRLDPSPEDRGAPWFRGGQLRLEEPCPVAELLGSSWPLTRKMVTIHWCSCCRTRPCTATSGYSGRGFQGVACHPVIGAPASGYHERDDTRINREGHTERGGRHRRRLGRAHVGRAFLGRLVATNRQLVELARGDQLAAGGEQPDEVAIADRALVDLLLGASGGAKEVPDDHLLKFLPDLRW
jgi:hypothetical protein